MTTGQLDEALRIDVEAPRRERYGPLHLAGIRREHPLVDESVHALDVQWQDLRADLASMDTGRDGAPVTFGVFSDMFTGSGTFSHLCGMHVEDAATAPSLPAGWELLELPALEYLVFPHRHPAPLLQKTVCTVWFEWLPASHHTTASGSGSDVPEFVERYGPDFDPESGEGSIEAWFPIQR